MRQHILKELHQSDPMIVRMKSLARLHVWWPGMDEDIKHLMHSCDSCNQQRDNAPPAPLHLWEYPSKPWHANFVAHLWKDVAYCGQHKNKMALSFSTKGGYKQNNYYCTNDSFLVFWSSRYYRDG